MNVFAMFSRVNVSVHSTRHDMQWGSIADPKRYVSTQERQVVNPQGPHLTEVLVDLLKFSIHIGQDILNDIDIFLLNIFQF